MRKFLFTSLFFCFFKTLAANELVVSSGTNVDLGSIVVGQSKTDTFTLTNTGTETVYFYEFFLDFTKGQINFAGLGDFPGDGGTCTGPEIVPQGSCTFTITLKPAAIATLKSNFKINYYYGTKLQKLTMTFTGAGIVAPPPPPRPVAAILKISDDTLFDFGEALLTSENFTKVFTITNSGELAARSMGGAGLALPFSFVDDAYPGTGGTCGGILIADESCTIVVRFQPQTTGVFSDAIEISYFDGYDAKTVTRDVRGLGVAPAHLKFYGNSTHYDFTIVKVGMVKVHTLILVNYGDVPATHIKGTGLKKPFHFAGGQPFPGAGGTCGPVLMPGKDCQVRLAFAPKTLGKFDEELKITYRDGLSLRSFQQELHGKSAAK